MRGLNWIEDPQLADAVAACDSRSVEDIGELNARRRGIRTLRGIERLTGLRKLHLGRNNIQDLTPLSSMDRLTGGLELEDLPWLRALDISRNDITEILLTHPLPRLHSLTASANRITTLDFLQLTPELSLLDLSENPIPPRPTELFASIRLKRLYLWNTGVSSLGGINRLAELEELGVADNELSDVEELRSNGRLNLLFLGGNRAIPHSELDSLTELQIADLRLPNWRER